MDTIAEETFVFIAASGSRTTGRIAFGTPYRATCGEYVCEVTLGGVDSKLHGIAGDSSLQALLLAARFVGKRLHDFRRRGGRVVCPTDDDADESDAALDALFGPMLCE